MIYIKIGSYVVTFLLGVAGGWALLKHLGYLKSAAEHEYGKLKSKLP